MAELGEGRGVLLVVGVERKGGEGLGGELVEGEKG